MLRHAASLCALCLASGIAAGQPVLNEIDWTQPGTDDAEFIEVFNPGPQAAWVGGLAVALVGPGGLEYARIELPPEMLAPGDYVLLAGPGVATPPGVLRVDLPAELLSDELPGGAALVDAFGGSVLDSLSFGGCLVSVSLVGIPGAVSLVEGECLPASATDGGSESSLARRPNGRDSGSAAADWGIGVPSPGTSNDRDACAPHCCDPDLNQDGNVDQDDLAYLIGVVAGGSNPTGIDPDFNRDGNADQDDIDALLNVIAGGPCP